MEKIADGLSKSMEAILLRRMYLVCAFPVHGLLHIPCIVNDADVEDSEVVSFQVRGLDGVWELGA